jgi:uncharacterized protein (TIGR03083 family)
VTSAAPDDVALVDLLETVWNDVLELGDGLAPEQWALPTECPGWSVQDNVAHLVGIESTILGMPAPDVDVSHLAHVKNDFGRMNEQWVEHYRSLAGADVLAELRTTAARRIADLRALDDAGWSADSFTPVGPGTVRDLIPFRIFDSWAHLHDMQRALGRPEDFDSDVARYCLRRAQRPLGAVVGKRVAPPEGTTVGFDVTGPGAFTYALRIEGGRAQPVAAPPPAADVRLTMSTETFVRLVNGRVDPEEVLAGDLVAISGDVVLGRAVVDHLNTML